MLGAIAGDIIGSVYEYNPIKVDNFPLFSTGNRFTDDTVLTVALADSILHGTEYVQNLKKYYFAYPGRGYGGSFFRWAESSDLRPYNSWGNGSAMRVSPVGFAYPDLATVLEQAKKSAEVTHNHPEGIKGAQATAAAIFLARQRKSKAEISQYISDTFGYPLGRTLAEIRPSYVFDESCQNTVPEAIIAFLESESFEDAIRKAVSLGGDSDTLACITGGIAEAYYGGVPDPISTRVFTVLDEHLSGIVKVFRQQFM
jgi:ADP-ribosylglycohydrolase